MGFLGTALDAVAGTVTLPARIAIRNVRLGLFMRALQIALVAVLVYYFYISRQFYFTASADMSLHIWSTQNSCIGASADCVSFTEKAQQELQSADFCTNPDQYNYYYVDSQAWEYRDFQCTSNSQSASIKMSDQLYFPTFYQEEISRNGETTKANYFTTAVEEQRTAVLLKYSVLDHKKVSRRGYSHPGPNEMAILIAREVEGVDGAVQYETFDAHLPQESGAFVVPVARWLAVAGVTLDEVNDADSMSRSDEAAQASSNTQEVMAWLSDAHAKGWYQPTFRLTGVNLVVKFQFYNSVGARGVNLQAGTIDGVQADDPEIFRDDWLNDQDGRVLCLAVVQVEKDLWTGLPQVWFTDTGHISRFYEGVKIEFQNGGEYGQFAWFDPQTVFNTIASVAVYIGFPVIIVNLVAVHLCGKTSRVYLKAQNKPVNLGMMFCNTACTLMMAKTTFESISGGEEKVTKEHFDRRLKDLFAENKALSEEEKNQMVEFVYQCLDNEGDESVTLSEFCTALTAGCVVSVADMAAAFDEQASAGPLGPLFIHGMKREQELVHQELAMESSPEAQEEATKVTPVSV
uniref:EF-hand domain-containing protein n=1 Tax=Oxyrrhis marina TaxID=2969 RepID=A0A7S4LNR5_OXYMA